MKIGSTAIAILTAFCFAPQVLLPLSTADETARVEWKYQTEFGERRFEWVDGKDWVHIFANGKRHPYVEVDRTDSVQPSIDVSVRDSRDSLTATVQAQDDRGLAFTCVVDNTANDGQLMLHAKQLSGTEQETVFRIAKKDIKSAESELMFVVIDTGGNFRRVLKPVQPDNE